MKNLKHSTINPLAFTDHGIAMLSSVLLSEKAILVNIEIMRTFSKYRSLIQENEELRKEIHALGRKLNRVFKIYGIKLTFCIKKRLPEIRSDLR